MSAAPTFFKRFLLPGFAFKAVVIGGGYATGRELAEFFLPSGPWGGILGMLLAMLCWSAVCCATFVFARDTSSTDYGAFFRALLGPAWFLFDIAYACLVLIMLSVFGAAAGAIGAALFGWPAIAGTLGLVLGIAGVAAFGSDSVERLFKYVTYFLYTVYLVFVVVAVLQSADRIGANFAASHAGAGWALGGLTYAGYNVVGAVVILPVLRHLTSRRDAVIAGLLAGPLAMLPAVLFYICMVAYYPEIGAVALPSDYMLVHLHAPLLHVVFQLMILAALLESGTGAVHAVNQRIVSVVGARGHRVSTAGRLLMSAAILIVSVFVAARFGLVALIAQGYRALAYLFIAVYAVPLLSYGVWTRLRKPLAGAASPEYGP
ncbi:MAG TPA: hypothetical protein VKP66_10460 [Steroidobacteraceae bacterium]|nr:hypothetical protein [Steroidobacteraceae bacterium]